MVIVGGKHSSNTVKLAEVCGEYCKACVHGLLLSDLLYPSDKGTGAVAVFDPFFLQQAENILSREFLKMIPCFIAI